MKNFGKLLSSIILCSNIIAHPVCTNFWGGTACGSGKVDAVNSQGVVNITGTEVVGQVKVQGSFNVKKAVLNTIEVHGSTAISDSRVLGKSSFLGSLEASSTNFNSDINVHSDEIEFDSCQINSLSITSNKKNSVIKLRGNTIAKQIIFNQPGGEVWLYDNAKIIEKVISGKVIHK